MFSNQDVDEAYQRIKNTIIFTPCVFSPCLSKSTGAQVFLKLENMQQTGSFKERGALNFLLARSACSKAVVAASAGNHAQAVALHASRLGVTAHIFMPLGTANNKVLQTERFNAQVKLVGNSYDEAFLAAELFSHEHDAEYLHAYNDLKVIIGQATVALEIHQQIGIPDFIFAPIGGGGLFSGIGRFFANLGSLSHPRMIGVEAAAFQSMARALDKGSAFSSIIEKTIAEGIAISKVGSLGHQICQDLRPTLISVDDNQIQSAIMLLLERQKIVSEGAGAAAVAGLLLPEWIAEVKNKKVVVVVSGGNIDISLLARLTGQELIKSGRLCRMSLVIKDTPGSLSELLKSISRAQANIVDIQHERYFATVKWNEVMVHVTVETKDDSHEQKMFAMLKADGYQISAHHLENILGLR